MFGAAIATVLSEFFVFLASAIYLRRFVGGIRYLKMLYGPAIGVSIITLLWIWVGPVHFIVLNLLSIALYLAVMKITQTHFQ